MKFSGWSLLVLLTSQAHCFAEDLFPKRPQYEAHHQREKNGPKTLLDRYYMSRVGQCVETPFSIDFSSPLISSMVMRYQLDCPKIYQAIMASAHFSKELKKPTLSTVREIRASWWLAQDHVDHTKTHHLAEQLMNIPAPKRSSERYRLSSALALLSALEAGPVQSRIEPSQALKELILMSQEALGEQVRASALNGLRLLHPQRRIRQQAMQELWTKYPQTPLADTLNTSNIKVTNWLMRGEAAFKARDYQKTIEALQLFSPLRASLDFVTPPQTRSFFKEEQSTEQISSFAEAKQRSALLISISLMRLREYASEAEYQLSIAFNGPDSKTSASALFYQTHLFSRLGRWDHSLNTLSRYLKTSPKGRKGREARYQVGRIKHQAGRYQQAIKSLRAFIATRPKDPKMYTWFLGWSYFRMGDCTGAIKEWRSLKKNRNLVVGPKARYWTARCLALVGHKKKALKELKAQLKMSPLGYYALLAHSLQARLTGTPFKWENPLKKHRIAHWKFATPPVPQKSIKKLKRNRYTREIGNKITDIFSLVTLGEESLARVKAKSMCRDQSISKKLKKTIGSKRTYRLCDSLEYYTGDHGVRWRRQSSKRIAWLTGFHKRSIRERVEAYPQAYYHLSVAAAEAEHISPWWLMSHMLQESRYRPEVVSYAQAIGLLQILGRTGKRIQQAIDWPKGSFFSDQLYDPALSVRYAAWYLNHLRDDLGHPLLAIGAYNGGPMRFADHQDSFKNQAFDIMVEELGAHESRNYLRKVADHFIRYLALYGTDQEWERWTQDLQIPEFTPTPQRTVGF